MVQFLFKEFIMKKNYGWHRDLPDFRDLTYKAVHKYSIQELPSSADLRPKMSPVENQDRLGSCTSFSLAGALEFLEEQSLVTKIASPEILTPNSYTVFSHLFIYYNERVIEGDVDEDGGGQLRDGIKTLATLGGCSEITWPYDESKVFNKPSDAAYQEALQHKITSYQALTSISDMKHCLADGFPFVFGFTVYDSFESAETAQTGIVKMPSFLDSCVGGHAVLAVGYSDVEQMFIVRNSWGSSWGLQGYFKMPYQYMVNPNLASDFWTIRR
jgi:C1A family cysteine protease